MWKVDNGAVPDLTIGIKNVKLYSCRLHLHKARRILSVILKADNCCFTAFMQSY